MNQHEIRVWYFVGRVRRKTVSTGVLFWLCQRGTVRKPCLPVLFWLCQRGTVRKPCLLVCCFGYVSVARLGNRAYWCVVLVMSIQHGWETVPTGVGTVRLGMQIA